MLWINWGGVGIEKIFEEIMAKIFPSLILKKTKTSRSKNLSQLPSIRKKKKREERGKKNKSIAKVI